MFSHNAFKTRALVAGEGTVGKGIDQDTLRHIHYYQQPLATQINKWLLRLLLLAALLARLAVTAMSLDRPNVCCVLLARRPV